MNSNDGHDTPIHIVPPRAVSESQSQMAEVVLPNDANPLGNLLGGRLMHLIDIAGALAAHRHSHSHVVTASIDHIDFRRPVHIGDLLILKSSVNRAFNTSMEIGVKCWVENYIEGTTRHVASAYLTFVAVDAHGKQKSVPQVAPETDEEKRRYEDAGRRRELRKWELGRKNAVKSYSATGIGARKTGSARSRIIKSKPMAHGHQHGAQQQGPFPLPGVSNIIAVGSGKGGVGKTTIAVNLAVALAKMGYKTGLLDADVYGPNVPLMMHTSQQPRVLNENLIEPLQNYGVKIISVGFLNPGDKPIVWRGPMLHQIIRQFLQQVVWGDLDYLVVDLPPGTGDVVISLFQTVPLSGAVVVSTPSDVSLQDGRKAIEMFRTARVDVLGLVENMSHFLCPHCHQEIDIFSKGGVERTAKEFGVPFLGSIELDPEIRKGGDAGQPPALAGENDPHAKSLYDFAKQVLMRLAEVKSSSAPGDVIQVQ